MNKPNEAEGTLNILNAVLSDDIYDSMLDSNETWYVDHEGSAIVISKDYVSIA